MGLSTTLRMLNSPRFAPQQGLTNNAIAVMKSLQITEFEDKPLYLH